MNKLLYDGGYICELRHIIDDDLGLGSGRIVVIRHLKRKNEKRTSKKEKKDGKSGMKSYRERRRAGEIVEGHISQIIKILVYFVSFSSLMIRLFCSYSFS